MRSAGSCHHGEALMLIIELDLRYGPVRTPKHVEERTIIVHRTNAALLMFQPEFKTASSVERVSEIAHLKPGMVLEGGAFVDIGVHQDGLVHISALSEKFVKDPREVVKAGQIVKVKVLEVDPKRQRIALTMRMSDAPADRSGPAARGAPGGGSGGMRPEKRMDRTSQGRVPPKSVPPSDGAMALAFAKLKRG